MAWLLPSPTQTIDTTAALQPAAKRRGRGCARRRAWGMKSSAETMSVPPARTDLAAWDRRPGSPPKLEDHRCATAPESHRTSLAPHHCANTAQQAKANFRQRPQSSQMARRGWDREVAAMPQSPVATITCSSSRVAPSAARASARTRLVAEEQGRSRSKRCPNYRGPAMTTPPHDGIVNLLLEDHQSAKQRLSEFTSSVVGAREELFWKLTDELVRHEVAEEMVLYPAVRKLSGGEQLADARISEQSEAELQLARMEKLDPGSPEFMAEFTDLKAAVLEHAQHEETEVFPLVEAEASSEDQFQLAERYQAAKRAAPNPPHPHAPDTPPGNKVLGPVAALVDRIRDA